LEEKDQSCRASERPVVQRVGGEASPLVEHEPDGLLSEEVGVSAVGEEASCVEATVELGLGVSIANLAIVSVLVLGGLVV
jgi:hypothetical protein